MTPPACDMAKVRAAAKEVGDRLEQQRQARIAARDADQPGQPCQNWDGRTRRHCGRPATNRYLTGWCCPLHTPAALNGRPEPTPDPALTLQGLRHTPPQPRQAPQPATDPPNPH